MRGSVLSPFRYSSYTIFWSCAFISNLGTWIRDVASSWVMTHLSTSPLTIALLSFSSSLPIVLFSIPAGYWSDRGDRRKILLLAQGLMVFAAFILGLLASLQALDEVALLLLCFLMGVGVALNGPAYQTVLSELVPPFEQQKAVLVYYMGLNITRVVGPAVGGFILGLSGAANAFYINAACFLGLIFYYWRWPLPSHPQAEQKSFTSRDLNFLFANHTLKLWGEIFLVSFCASCLWALYPVRGRLELHLESLQYGSLLGFLGLGAFLSVLFAGKFMQPQRTKESLSFAYVIFAAGQLFLAMAETYVVACIGMILAGTGWIVLATLMNMSSRQLTSSNHFKATQLGVFLSVFYLGMSLGSVSWGAIAKLLSTSQALMISSGLLILVGIFKRKYRDKESHI